MTTFPTRPNDQMITEIARHLIEVHGEGLDPAKDICWPDYTPAGASVSYLPETPRRPAGFSCSMCIGHRSFPVEPTYGHPARNRQLVRDNPTLADDIRGLTSDEAAIVIEHWDRSRATRSVRVLREVLRQDAQATRPANDTHASARVRRCQDYLLEAWVRRGTQDAAIWDLIALADADPVRHREVVGRRYPMAYETYRSYLKSADPIRKAAVRAALRAA